MTETNGSGRSLTEAEAAERASRRIARRVLSQWWLIGLCGLIAAVVAFGVSSLRTPQYEAKTTIEIGTTDLVNIYLSDSVSISNQDPDLLKSGAVDELTLANVRSGTSERLQGRLSPGEIAKAVRIENVPDSSVVRVVGTSADPSLAAALANATVRTFVQQRSQRAGAQIEQARQSVMRRLAGLPETQRQSQEAQLLRQRLRDISALGELPNANVTVIQPATLPTSPVSPNPRRDAILGLLVGLLVGLGFALLRARLDDKIRDAEELREHWDLPVLGLIPQNSTLQNDGRMLPEPAALEPVALAMTNLRYVHVGGSVKTLLVTSATEAEGKSTLTWNLAVSASLSSQRVLVVEADLRRPGLSKRLGISGNGGLSEVLAGMTEPADAIRSVVIGSDDGLTSTRVDVVPAGMTPPSPLTLLETPRAVEVMRELSKGYDIVFFDTPPATVVGDAVSLLRAGDGVLVVSRLGALRRGAFDRLREIMLGAGANVVGLVVNGDNEATNYGYYAARVADPRLAEAQRQAEPSAPSKGSASPAGARGE